MSDQEKKKKLSPQERAVEKIREERKKEGNKKIEEAVREAAKAKEVYENTVAKCAKVISDTENDIASLEKTLEETLEDM